LNLSPVVADPLEDCAEFAVMGVPSNDGTLLCRMGYFLGHDPDFKTPLWVAECITKKHEFGAHPRSPFLISLVLPDEFAFYHMDV